MDYSFNAEIAKEYGVNEAVFIHNIYWWIRKNEANGRHYYDGRNWTYNSMKAFSELFPFWTQRQIRHIINKLQANGAIHIGNYNQAGFDRTNWYALDESVLSIYECGEWNGQNCQMGVTELSNGNAENVTPIPDSKPYINTDSKPDRVAQPRKQKYGDYKNVLLSADDFEKLKAEYPSDYLQRIERLSEYIASTGKKYKNHLATIRAWARRDKSEPDGNSAGNCKSPRNLSGGTRV